MRSLRSVVPAVLLSAAMVLSACGTTDEAVSDDAPAAGEAITITDSRGETVTLDGPATKVVTLEWGLTENVLALGVTPSGIADIDGFKAWNTAVEVPDGPVDVGLRSEPSVESVAKADPDLIIGIEDSIPADAMAQMEEIAPVVILTAADASRPLELMRENFTTTATLLGKESEADALLATFDQTVADGKAAITAAAPGPYVFVGAYGEANQVTFRMHGDGSMPGAVAKELGLVNGFTGETDAAWGLGSLDVEGLTTLPADTDFLYWYDPDANPITDLLPSNPVWTTLPFVQAGQVTEFGKGVWMYGGPVSMTRVAEAFVAHFAG